MQVWVGSSRMTGNPEVMPWEGSRILVTRHSALAGSEDRHGRSSTVARRNQPGSFASGTLHPNRLQRVFDCGPRYKYMCTRWRRSQEMGVLQHDRRENESFIARVFFLVRETGGYGRSYSPMQCPNALPNHR